MAKKKPATATAPVIVKTFVSRPKPSKPQTKNENYERVISDFSSTPDISVVVSYLNDKFKSKEISLSTIADARTELFSLMTYVEGNERYTPQLVQFICKVSENIAVESGKIRYKV